jgi:IMP dehydrogenase
MIDVVKGYTFDDVLLIPKHSEISSRQNINTSVNLGRGVRLDIPIVSANMKHVTGVNMAKKIASLGGLAILHRFDLDSNILSNYTEATFSSIQWSCNIGASVGVHTQDRKLVDSLLSARCKIICVDVAHGDHDMAGDMVTYIRRKSDDVLIIAGNVATPEGAEFLSRAGADVIKVGVGPGSLCTTRTETGNGVPQLTALSDVYNNATYQASRYKYKIIADGGIKAAGDVVKALCFSHCVMIGNLLAGTSESPGDQLNVNGKIYKEYAGSSTHKTSHIEGVTGLVPYKGETGAVIERLMQGVRSGMSYQGVANLEDLRQCPKFVSISHAGLTESLPHDVWVR